MRSLFRRAGAPAALVALTLSSCLGSTVTDTGPQAAVKVINLLQGVDNASIGFETGRPLTLVAFPSIAPTEAGSFFFTTAEKDRQLRVLLTTTTVLDSAVRFGENQVYTIVTLGVNGTTGRTAPRYLVLNDIRSPVTTGSVRFRFIHGASSVAAVDVHIVPDTGTFSSVTRVFDNVTYGATVFTETRLGNTRSMCVVAAGVTPTPNGSNCTVLRQYGVAPGSIMTTALREPRATETKPDILFTLDRAP